MPNLLAQNQFPSLLIAAKTNTKICSKLSNPNIYIISLSQSCSIYNILFSWMYFWHAMACTTDQTMHTNNRPNFTAFYCWMFA